MEILLLTPLPLTSAVSQLLPALELLNHHVRRAARQAHVALPHAQRTNPDAVLVDAKEDLADARSLCRLLHTTGLRAPLFAIVTEGGLAAISPDWGIDDFLLTTAGPAEITARLRLVHRVAEAKTTSDTIRAGDLTIEGDTYTARVRSRPLDLTYKEFELLKYLAQHPGRVYSREQLLREVWGYDYFGGTRTVDVHVRRLRAKLGSEHEAMIGTVRHVGYRFVAPALRPLPEESRVTQHG